jgi:hypothetical protein
MTHTYELGIVVIIIAVSPSLLTVRSKPPVAEVIDCRVDFCVDDSRGLLDRSPEDGVDKFDERFAAPKETCNDNSVAGELAPLFLLVSREALTMWLLRREIDARSVWNDQSLHLHANSFVFSRVNLRIVFLQSLNQDGSGINRTENRRIRHQR